MKKKTLPSPSLKSRKTATSVSSKPSNTTVTSPEEMDIESAENISTPVPVLTPVEFSTTRGICPVSATSSSHTQYFKRNNIDKERFDRINSDIYCGKSESISGSSDTFHCQHGPTGKKYTKEGLLKRNLLKELDPIKNDPKWTENSKPTYGWEIAKTLVFLIQQPKEIRFMDRIIENLDNFVVTSKDGFHLHIIEDLYIIIEYLVENAEKNPELKKRLASLLKNFSKPLILKVNSDVVTRFDKIRDFITYLAYLTMEFTDNDMFDLVTNALLYHLSCPDKFRGKNAVQLRHSLAAARKVLVDTILYNIAIASPRRFLPYMQLALLLTSDHEENCIDFMKVNILENIFYRFNPYFPNRDLPEYDINPFDVNDVNIVLGDSSVHISTTLSLLLILMKTIMDLIRRDPTYENVFPHPDYYAQRCFIWAYRYECRKRDHHHERCTMTVIADAMLYIFKQKLTVILYELMPDILTLSVQSEIPLKNNWTRYVHMGISINCTQFKKLLIKLSSHCLRVHTANKFMAESENWVMGLMYLIDPALVPLRGKWDSVVNAELRKTALQALVVTMKHIPINLVMDINLIRRLLWYIEWYSESPYETSILYWTVRVIQASMYRRTDSVRTPTVKELFKTHGIIIFLRLCNTLMDAKYPLMEMNQTVLGLVLRLLTSAVRVPGKVDCIVYPEIHWPNSVNQLIKKMMYIVTLSLKNYCNICDRWLVSMMNFIWEAVVWNKTNREKFIENKGIYQLLDIVTMTRYPSQCITLALICDIVRAGDAVGQLVTWRATYESSSAHPFLVKRGSTIGTLIAAICKKDLVDEKIRLDENNVLQDLEYPMMSYNLRKYIFDPKIPEADKGSGAAADIVGSRFSKCFAILQMLSEDLQYKVDLADEAYHLYKDMPLSVADECMLLLCSYFLTFKLSEVWLETKMQFDSFLPQDTELLNEFLHIGRGWAKYVHEQQLQIVQKRNRKEHEKERSLYSFLEHIRLNRALDALFEVRCMARSSDRNCMTHTLLYEAIKNYHRRSMATKKLDANIISTYKPPLDENNTLGLCVQVTNIRPKNHPKKREIIATPSGSSEDTGSEQVYIKEAKYSQEPQASHIDFGGLRDSKTSKHTTDYVDSTASPVSH